MLDAQVNAAVADPRGSTPRRGLFVKLFLLQREDDKLAGVHSTEAQPSGIGGRGRNGAGGQTLRSGGGRRGGALDGPGGSAPWGASHRPWPPPAPGPPRPACTNP